MIKRIIELSIMVFLFYSCVTPAPINIKGRYFLENDDLGRYLGYQTNQPEISLVLVDHYVFAAGYNDNFIVAIQHPQKSSGESVDSNYYIVPFRNKFTYSPRDGIIGPLTFEAYKLKMEQLGIGQITWVKLK